MITQNLDGTRAVKILDFGLAAEIRNSLSRVSRDIGDTSGTRPYMAPEQWTGSRQNEKSDQYSLAVLLYELLDGEVPFASVFGSCDTNLMMKAVCERSTEPLECLSLEQNQAFARALSKERTQRFSTCRAFLDALLLSKQAAFNQRNTSVHTSGRTQVEGIRASCHASERELHKQVHLSRLAVASFVFGIVALIGLLFGFVL